MKKSFTCEIAPDSDSLVIQQIDQRVFVTVEGEEATVSVGLNAADTRRLAINLLRLAERTFT